MFKMLNVDSKKQIQILLFLPVFLSANKESVHPHSVRKCPANVKWTKMPICLLVCLLYISRPLKQGSQTQINTRTAF